MADSQISKKQSKTKKVTNLSEFEGELQRTVRKYIKHGVDIQANAVKLHKLITYDRAIPLPVPLPRSVSINKGLVNDFSAVNVLHLFKVKAAFESSDPRYLHVEEGEALTGLVQTQGWVFAVKDNDSQGVGFIPANYLTLTDKVTG